MKSPHNKRNYRNQILIGALIAALTFPSWLLGQLVTASSPVDSEIISSFELLKKHVRGQALEEKLEEAQTAFSKSDSCTGARILLNALNEIRPIAEDLHNRIWTLRQDILSMVPDGKGCEDSPRTNRAPEVQIFESDEQHLRGRVTFGEPRMTSVRVEGELYTELDLPGVDIKVGQPGVPGVPVIHKLVAVPQGATAVVTVKADEGQAQTFRVNLYPIQPEALDRASDKSAADRQKEPPFTKDKEVYARDEAYPAHIGKASHLGRARDLQLAQISIAAGQYNPVTKMLTLFSSVDFDVRFEGGKGEFINGTAMSVFEPLTVQYLSQVLNGGIVAERVGDRLPSRINCGEEFLILTHPDFRIAADTLAEWKNDKGIMTSVVEVNDGDGSGPDTKEEIDAFIQGRFNRCALRPSYLLLFGDAEFIPTFYVATSGSDTTGSDYKYALLDGPDSDLMPDFALGRIPVDTLQQANTVVRKIVQYESNPPHVVSFYNNVGIASQFQCCRPTGQEGRDQRSFIETSEFVRDVLVNRDYSVDRIYTRTTATSYDGDPIPRRYYNGTLLPSELREANGFTWDGDTDQIVDAFNAGRFLFLHRDHGSKDGWAHPSFTSFNVVADLANGDLLPVVFSVNCASGLFDNETADGDYGTQPDRLYFSELLLRKSDGGAVGVLGDTRDSPTWANSALTRGFFDAVWPETLPDFGNYKSLRRLGDILNHGKFYLATQVGVEGTTEAPSQGNLNSELFLWHVIGDPTLEMWTSRPFLLPWEYEVFANPTWLKVKYAMTGATITAYQKTKKGVRELGRAEVIDGEATMPLFRQPIPGEPIQLSASLENGVSVKLTAAKRR